MRWEELWVYLYSYFLDVHKIWPRLSHELIRDIKIINYFVGLCIIPCGFFTMTRKAYQTVYTQVYWPLDTNSIFKWIINIIFNSECISFEVTVTVLKMWSIFCILSIKFSIYIICLTWGYRDEETWCLPFMK